MSSEIVAIRERCKCVYVLDYIVSVGLLDVYYDGNYDNDYIGLVPRRRLVIEDAIDAHIYRIGAIWFCCIAGDIHCVHVVLNTV